MSESLEERIAQKALAYVTDPPTGDDPVIDHASPAELQMLFDDATPLGFGDHAFAIEDDDVGARVCCP